MKIKIFFSLIIIHYLFSCSDKINEDGLYMTFENIERVKEFGITEKIKPISTPNIDLIGLKSFIIKDSLLITYNIGKKGMLTFYLLPSYKKLGNFLDRGDGPNEHGSGPWISDNHSIRKINGSYQLTLYDFNSGKVLDVDLKKSLLNNETILKNETFQLPPNLFEFSVIDSTTYFVKELGNSDTQQLRFLITNDEFTVPPIFERLNSISINPREDFNILSTQSKYSPKVKRIIEAPIGLNYINIYSLDGTFSKSLFIGDSPSDINLIQKLDRFERMYIFSDLRIFETFFGVVFINQTEMEYELSGAKGSTILLFDYEGNPLAKLIPETPLTSFDIDLEKGELYGFNLKTDEFLKYNVKNILNKIK